MITSTFLSASNDTLVLRSAPQPIAIVTNVISIEKTDPPYDDSADLPIGIASMAEYVQSRLVSVELASKGPEVV